jgi:phosphoribosylformylglycinamidine synthase
MSVAAGVIVFPGANCDRDIAVALDAAGAAVTMVWHKETSLPAGLDLVAIPGGFSFGDYLRCGAIAARSPVMRAVTDFADRGGHVLGICNGFQVLIESGLLPGALMRNAGLRFLCGTTPLVVGTSESAFTAGYRAGEAIRLPIAHHDGNYFADDATLDRLEGEDLVAFRYAENPNGSARAIAGILSANRRVLGLMPHPERAVDPLHGGTDGQRLFSGLLTAITANATAKLTAKSTADQSA